jgi:hypothetical protein
MIRRLFFWCMMSTLLAAAAAGFQELERMTKRFAPVTLHPDESRLSEGDRKALAKLKETAGVIDDIFLDQLWSGNQSLYARLKRDHSALGRARLHYFWINKSPWSDLDGHKAFLDGAPPVKLPGANFYPEDMTRGEFEAWVKTLTPAEKAVATGFFSVIRRENGKLKAIPYSQAYRANLERATKLLREAAALTGNASLRKFLTLRAEAFLSDDYYASDLAWMDLDAPIDVTIGPYETYNDEIFGYKAAFEAYITLRDDAETEKLKSFGSHLQEVENHLPIEPRYRNPKLAAQAPIRVVNQVLAAGDGDHGVKTAAFNLPNDERVVAQKGSKRVMLKNVQEAKFETILTPIARRVLAPQARSDSNFEAFFTHILAHELSHGIGPQQIRVDGRDTTPRQEMKELYSAIEEAKADITGLFMLQYFYDRGVLKGGADAERRLYTTYLASSFRTLRFGLKEAHGKGMAMQFNYLADHGAFVENPDGTFAVDFSKIKDGVRGLTHELLTLEATGDYAGAKKMLDKLGVIRPGMAKAIQGMSDIPVDIDPR